MSFLQGWQQQQMHHSAKNYDGLKMMAKDKKVIIIGGGDTGVDCIATSIRQVITRLILESFIFF